MPRSVVAILMTVSATAMTMFSAPATARSIEGRVPSSGDITLFQSPGRVMVMMRIGDDELIPMIFDTGSDGNSFDRLIVKRQHLRQVGTTIEVDGSTGERRTLPRVAVKNVTIGGLPVGTLEGVALDCDRNDAMGIISSDIFTDSYVYLDLANSRARLVPRATTSPPAGPAFEYVENIPSVQLLMPDGSTLSAHFDTGFDGALSLPIGMMDKVALIEPARVVGRFKSINTVGDVYGGRIRGKLRIGPLELDNPEVTFLGDIANIGLPIIRQLTLVIDPKLKRDWVLPAGTRPPVP